MLTTFIRFICLTSSLYYFHENRYQIKLLINSNEHAISLSLIGQSVRFPLPTLLYVGYFVKLIVLYISLFFKYYNTFDRQP